MVLRWPQIPGSCRCWALVLATLLVPGPAHALLDKPAQADQGQLLPFVPNSNAVDGYGTMPGRKLLQSFSCARTTLPAAFAPGRGSATGSLLITGSDICFAVPFTITIQDMFMSTRGQSPVFATASYTGRFVASSSTSTCSTPVTESDVKGVVEPAARTSALKSYDVSPGISLTDVCVDLQTNCASANCLLVSDQITCPATCGAFGACTRSWYLASSMVTTIQVSTSTCCTASSCAAQASGLVSDVRSISTSSTSTPSDGSTFTPPSDGSTFTSTSNRSTSSDKKKVNAGAIAGGVIGGIVGIALIVGLIIFFVKRKQRNRYNNPSAPSTMSQLSDPKLANLAQKPAQGDAYGVGGPQGPTAGASPWASQPMQPAGASPWLSTAPAAHVQVQLMQPMAMGKVGDATDATGSVSTQQASTGYTSPSTTLPSSAYHTGTHTAGSVTPPPNPSASVGPAAQIAAPYPSASVGPAAHIVAPYPSNSGTIGPVASVAAPPPGINTVSRAGPVAPPASLGIQGAVGPAPPVAAAGSAPHLPLGPLAANNPYQLQRAGASEAVPAVGLTMTAATTRGKVVQPGSAPVAPPAPPPERTQRASHTLDTLRISWHDITQSSLIGEGGFGQVYKGLWQGNRVAVKLLNPERAQATVLRELQQEALIMAELRHPCIARVFGLVDEPPYHALVMQYYRKGTLQKYMTTPGYAATTLVARLRMALQVASAMRYLHDKRMLHGDLKTSNLLLADDYTVCIADFGLASALTSNDTGGEHSGALTLSISPPEVLMNPRAPRTPAADVYAFGIVLLEVLTGSRPYQGLRPQQLKQIVCAGQRPALPEGLAPDLQQLITSCWHQDPAVRPSFKVITDQLHTVVQQVDPAQGNLDTTITDTYM